MFNRGSAITYLGLDKKTPRWSTAYTNECCPGYTIPVSKYMKDTRPVHLYFNRHLPDVYHTTETLDKQKEFSRNIYYCKSWSDLSENMKLDPMSICFHVSELQYTTAVEIVNMVTTLAKLLGVTHVITVSAGIEKDTETSVIKDLQKSNISGIIPSMVSFGPDETIKGLNAQWNNIPYWPKHILDQLPGSKKKKVNNLSKDDIKLTPRQDQILHLIQERGSSNKVIAKTLGITESTVKLHVGLVLKKFGVRNRTQLAVYSKK